MGILAVTTKIINHHLKCPSITLENLRRLLALIILSLFLSTALQAILEESFGDIPDEGPLLARAYPPVASAAGATEEVDSIAPLYVHVMGPANMTMTATGIVNIGDADGDGTEDLVLSNSPGYRGYPEHNETEMTHMLYGRTSRSYVNTSMQRLSVINRPWYLDAERRLGDVNGDGFADLVGMRDDDIVIAYGGEGGIVDRAAAVIPLCLTAPKPGYAPITVYGGAGDMNADGFDDMFVHINWRSPEAQAGNLFSPSKNVIEFLVHHGSKNGLSSAAGWNVSFEAFANETYGSFGTADLNGDGFSDVIAHMDAFLGSTDGIRVIDSSPEGVPADYTRKYMHWALIRPQYGVETNGDSMAEKVFGYGLNWHSWTNDEPPLTVVAIHNGTTSGYTWPPWEVVLEEEQVSHLLMCDIDGDGLDDIVTACYEVDYPEISPSVYPYSGGSVNITVRVHLNRGGSFPSAWDWQRTVRTPGMGVPSAARGDLDGDGKDDLAFGVTGNVELVTHILPDGHSEPVFCSPGGVLIMFGQGIVDCMHPVKVRGGPRLYSAYRTYDFSANLNPFDQRITLDHSILTLDPVGAAVVLEFDPALEGCSFRELSDPFDCIELRANESYTTIDRANNTAWAHFLVVIGWNWPHESMCDAHLELMPTAHGLGFNFTKAGLFSVEDDLSLAGPVAVEGEWQGPVAEGGWARANESMTVHGARVVYEGTTSTYPPDGSCTVWLEDNDGDSVSCVPLRGEEVDLGYRADGSSDAEERLLLTLEDLPEGSDRTPGLTFRLGVDGDAPTFRDADPAPDSWHCQRNVLLSVTVDDAGLSGVAGDSIAFSYSISAVPSFGQWGGEGLLVVPMGPHFRGLVELRLLEGSGNLVMWRASDRVGNEAVSDALRVQVDTINVTFKDPRPEELEWRCALDVECGVTITDNDGAGIDVPSVQYRWSTTDLWGYKGWTDWDEGGTVDGVTVSPRAVIHLAEGLANRIQWRAMDLAGNGYTTSPHYAVRTDVTPIVWTDFWPANGIILVNETVLCIASVEDGAPGSGVDPQSIEYRFLTGAPPGIVQGRIWSEWKKAEVVEGSQALSVRVDLRLVHSASNMVQFRGADIAGNGPTESPVHTIAVDARPPELIDLIPKADARQPGPTVELRATVDDDLSGIDHFQVWCRLSVAGLSELQGWTHMEVLEVEGRHMGRALMELPRGSSSVEVRASDQVGNRATWGPFTILVNELPVALIREPRPGAELHEGDLIRVDGSVSYDPEGGALNFTWSLGQGGAPIAWGADGHIMLVEGAHEIVLRVTDEDGASSVASMKVTVQPKMEPRVVEGRGDALWPLAILVVVFIAAVAEVLRRRLAGDGPRDR